MELHKGQKAVLEMTMRFPEVCVMAGRGWGKSFLAAHLLAWWGMRASAGWTLWWIAKEKAQAKAIGFDAFMSWFSDIVESHNQNEGYARLHSGARIEFVGTDSDPDALRGRNLRAAVWDEPFICHYAFYDTVLKPALRHEDAKLLLIGTMPHLHEDTDPRWFSYLLDAKDKGFLYVGTSRENEGYGIPVGWVDARLAEAEARGMGSVARAEYLCEMADLFEKTLWARGVPEILSRPRPASAAVARVVGIDPHLSRPNAWVGVEYYPDGVVAVLMAEYVEQPLAKLAERIRQWERRRGPATLYCVDPHIVRQHVRIASEPWSVRELFLGLDLPVQPGEISVLVWANDMAELSRQRRFHVLSSCKGLLDQLAVYTAEKVTGKFKKRYMHQFDLVDALRYAMSRRLHLSLGSTIMEGELPPDGIDLSGVSASKIRLE